MSKGIIDDLLRLGSILDWITPLGDLIVGYNTIEEVPNDYYYCEQVEKELKSKGIKCRVNLTDDGDWQVISKR